MEKMNDLKDLLRHEIQDLYSAEEQIIKAMPAMIQKASSWDLKKALEEHLNITRTQIKRLEQAQRMLNEDGAEPAAAPEKKPGLLSRLFKRNQVCRGMQGLIEEGEKVMSEEMSPEVLDAAIIASAQKIEHYEICGYGTAKAFARELNMEQLENLLQETLDEEYEADERLTRLAIHRLNEEAEKAGGNGKRAKAKVPVSSKAVGSDRTSNRERAEARTQELEMVNDRSGKGSAAPKKSSTSSKGTAPKGGSPERGEPSGRSAAEKNTTGARSQKNTSKSSGRSTNKSGGRSNISRSGSTRRH